MMWQDTTSSVDADESEIWETCVGAAKWSDLLGGTLDEDLQGGSGPSPGHHCHALLSRLEREGPQDRHLMLVRVDALPGLGLDEDWCY